MILLRNSSVKSLVRALIACCASAAFLSNQALAQGLRFELGTGAVVPTGPTATSLGTGVQFRAGVSQSMDARPFALGVNATYSLFSNHKQRSFDADRFSLLNVFITGQYRLSSGRVRPYVLGGFGIVQERLTPPGRPTGGELNGGGTGALGLETDLGSLHASLEAGYVGISTLKYRNALVRYVPITVRLRF